MTVNKMMGALSASAFAVAAIATPALADGWDHGGSTKDAPVENSRKWTFSFNIGGTSDYVFRGVSQSDEKPSIFGGADITYGIIYAGVWAARTDENFVATNAEIDLYGGITPSLGIMDFDFGFIYYGYPDQDKAISLGLDVDYWELKAGVSTDDLIKNLTIGATVYWSPDYTLETGDVWTVEGSLAYALPAMGIFSPTISGLIGYQSGNASDGFFFDTVTLEDEYWYWNVGLEVAVEKLTFDFRYWDTDLPSGPNAVISPGLTDERFVFTGTFTY